MQGVCPHSAPQAASPAVVPAPPGFSLVSVLRGQLPMLAWPLGAGDSPLPCVPWRWGAAVPCGCVCPEGKDAAHRQPLSTCELTPRRHSTHLVRG